MKLIQILVLVAAMAVAAAGQNTSSTSQNSGSNAKGTANQTQKKAGSLTTSKANPGSKSSQSSGNTQTSGVKLIVPKAGAATKSSSSANARGASASTGSSKASTPTTSTKASSATKSTSAVKTPVLTVKPAPKPVAKAKTAPLAATTKKKSVVSKKQNQIKIVPQKVASVDKPAAKETIVAGGSRRDPFLSIIRAMPSAAGPNCSVGKRCLFIPELELKGIAKDPEGQMMAVVVSSTHRAYFLRENDQVFNGSVQRITSDSVVFREFSTDHLGRETAHEVVKKIPRS